MLAVLFIRDNRISRKPANWFVQCDLSHRNSSLVIKAANIVLPKWFGEKMLNSQLSGGIVVFVVLFTIMSCISICCWTISRGQRKRSHQGRTGKMQVYK